MIYKASLDNLAKGITIGISILFLLIIIGNFSIIEEVSPAIPYFTATLLISVYIIAFALRPVNYELASEQLIIHRPIMDVKIDRKQIKTVELLANGSLGWSLRIFGVGGLFGYYGKFANSKIGSMTWYATRRDKTVLVTTTNNKKIIVTPDEPEKFVAEFNV